jgi:hypothetical protein
VPERHDGATHGDELPRRKPHRTSHGHPVNKGSVAGVEVSNGDPAFVDYHGEVTPRHIQVIEYAQVNVGVSTEYVLADR